MHGYYRTRFIPLYNIDLQGNNTNIANSNNSNSLMYFTQQRLRIEPTAKFNDYLQISSQIDFLDNILYGTNTPVRQQILDPVIGTITAPATAGAVSIVGGPAGEGGSINVRRIWMDIMTPIGKLRIGRQPSHWGLGIFQNDGNIRQGDFGDTFDRVLYLAQMPVGPKGALTLGGLWDIPFEAQTDPLTTNLSTSTVANGQNMGQYAFVGYYEQPEFTIGTFSGIRRRSGGNGTTTTARDINGTLQAAGIDGPTLMYFLDAYARVNLKHHRFQFEYIYLGGHVSTGIAIDAIPFTGLAAPGIIQLPANQSIGVNMAAAEAKGFYDFGGEWEARGGFAQGDSSPLSNKITQYGFRHDYQLGLMMFYYPLGTSPSLYSSATGAKLAGGQAITGNNINNAIFATVKYMQEINVKNAIPQANYLKVGIKGITAWADKPPVSLNFAQILNNANMPVIESRGKWYGVETDLIAEAQFFDHLWTSFEAAILFPGSAYNINVNVTDPGGIINPIPYDRAEMSYAGRLTLSLEF
ncbi:MAG: hypothetical protein COV45_00250 [Deltaproteobacteria bacterium CG11_big_fil_rev_8_21_14_0_20_47_16]|nr:MAG: hypothetical protein COV45_00250 [Deltaproteobacteria bacterium CG11_big_fil_rev_8_21_14_0_20_47_16]